MKRHYFGNYHWQQSSLSAGRVSRRGTTGAIILLSLPATQFEESTMKTNVFAALFITAFAAASSYAFDSANPRLAEDGFSRTPIASQIAENGFDRTPLSQIIAENGFDRTPLGQTIAENGFDRTPLGQTIAENGFDRTPLGQTIAENGFDRTPLGKTIG
jgi:hypothetical protein